MKVIFSDRAYASVLAETAEKITTETGGLFLGVVRENTWYILEAIDPGPKSVFEVAYFEYDQKYTEHLINKIANLYSHRLDLIGLWHRHPGSFDQFSSTDDGTNTKYASMRKEGAISALVNVDPHFRLTMYHVAPPCRYGKIPFEVGNDRIPPELLAFRTPERFFSLMEKRLRAASGRHDRAVSLAAFMRSVLPYIGEIECERTDGMAVMDAETTEKLAGAVMEDLTFLADRADIRVTLAMQDQYLVISQETAEGTDRLYFMDSVSRGQIVFFYHDRCYPYHSGMLEDAAGKAKADRDRQNAGADPGGRPKRQGSVFDSVMRIVKFSRNEEADHGDQNS